MLPHTTKRGWISVLILGAAASGCLIEPGASQNNTDAADGEARTVESALAPLIIWPSAPDTSGIVQGDVGTYPTVTASEGFSLADLVILDVPEGLVSVSLIVDTTETYFETTFAPPSLVASSGFTCDMGLCPPDDATFSYGALADGPHCAVLTAEDSAGNMEVRPICFVLDTSPPTLPEVIAAATGVCDQVNTAMGTFGPMDLQYEEAQAAISLCAAGLECLNATPNPGFGCYVLSQVQAHKSLLNVENDGGGDTKAIRDLIVDTSTMAMRNLEDAVTVAHEPSFENGVAELNAVLAAPTTTEAMTIIEAAYFWFEEARAPHLAIENESQTCTTLAALSIEFDAYANDLNDFPAAQSIADVKVTLDEVKFLLCDSGLNVQNACYDNNLLSGLSLLMDTASQLKVLRNASDATDEGLLVWTQNWQLGVSRVAQYWLNFALGNLSLWVNLGGVADGYEIVQQEANDSWGDAEGLLEDGDLGQFIARFTDPAAKCLMYEAYEYVNNWWEDLENPNCASVPYPSVCVGTWPLHGGRFPNNQLTSATIYDVQQGVFDEGKGVSITGAIVTAVGLAGFYMQDPMGGPYSGIFVKTTSPVTVGDRVDIEGVYREKSQGVSDMSQLVEPNVTITASGNPLPAAELLALDAIDETWEGVLVRVEGVTSSMAIDVDGVWQVEQGVNALSVDAQLFTYAGDTTVGVGFTSIAGPILDIFGELRIAPRDAADIVAGP